MTTLNHKNNLEPFSLYIGAFLLAFLFCLKFSLTTSPLYAIQGDDSAMFYVIGKSWFKGYLPYVSLWDQKGPLIFLINGLGYLLAGSKLGVFFIQVISLGVFLVFTYKTFNLYFSSLASAGLSIISLFWLACSYEGGNLTEEYLLPFSALSIYLTCCWIDRFESDPLDHNPWNAFLFGFILGFCFLTRLTNALVSCGMMAGIGLLLIIHGRWKNFFMNVLAYLGGFAAIVLPFCAYFAFHGAFEEMLFGTFIFNVSYLSASAETSMTSGPVLKSFILFIILAVNCFGLLFLSAFNFVFDKKKRARALIWFLATALLSLWYSNSFLCAHYRTVALPLFPVLFYEVYCLRTRYPKIISIVLASCLVLGPLAQTLRKWNSFVDYYNDADLNATVAEYVRETLPPDGLESFIGYGCSQGVYVLLDVTPCYRNFSFQETMSSRSNRVKEDIIKEFGSCEAEYILVNGGAPLIKDILAEHYQPLPPCEAHPSYRIFKKVTNNTDPL